jgi:hypothetical protein
MLGFVGSVPPEPYASRTGCSTLAVDMEQGTVVGQKVTTPDTLSQYKPNAEPGDCYGGAQALAQSFFFRPLPGQPSHRTFVPKASVIETGPMHGNRSGRKSPGPESLP